ncbi:DUF2142 domain-containing protein [Butyrivibrio fibrisolvens]|uniref:DUF2142 domain-containing protein n=1 Tax=Butyrivibrio fibrisolvens TaxID=831 RepID=A0A317FX02_BUTFI|nr:DUF2142 domain-containing protein [Butyrivibrio fibrisolvens]PWT26168.1 hypothetical protein CPT75_03060 [Butyrivibrio fibrisolvens]
MAGYTTKENAIVQNKNNNIFRYIAAGIIFLLLVLIWPLSLFQTTDSDINNRLLKEDDSYTYYYLSSGEYITTVLKGDGSYIDNGAVRLRFQGQVPQDACMHYYMYDPEGNMVVDQHIDLFERPENDVYQIPFGIVMDKGAGYQFIIAPDNDFTVGVYCLGESTEPAVVMHSSDQISSTTPVAVSGILKLCIWICGLLCIGMLIGSAVFESKAKNSCLFDTKAFIPAILSLLSIIVYGQYLFDHNIESGEGLIKGAFFVVIITIMAFMCIFAGRFKLLIYGFLILAVGSIYILTFPAGSIPDEVNHFYRAFSLAFGNLQSVKFSDTSVGSVLPTAIQALSDPEAVFDFADTAQIDFNNTSLYAPVCYIPQIIGIRIALLFTGNVYSVFMTARWAGFIGAFILYMFALYIIPAGRELLFAVMMLPMTIQEMTGVTSDGMTNAIAFLFIALVLKKAVSDSDLSKKDLVLITILGTLVGMCKIVYIVLLILLLLIPVGNTSGEGNDHHSKKSDNSRFTYGIMFGIPVIMCLISNVFFGQNLVSNGENMEAGAQIKYVLTHIPATIMTVIRSTIEYGMQWIGEMTGDYLGQLNIRTLPVVTLVLVIVLIVSSKNIRLPKELRSVKAIWIYGLISVFGFLLILGSIYATWNTVGDFLIRGIQGRYFLTILPVFGMFIAALSSKGVNDDNDGQLSYFYDYHIGSYILLVINMLVIVDVYTYIIMNG